MEKNWESYDKPSFKKTMGKAEEPVVQEPDWIPAGDGRAIGQQDFAINLSPLHAENDDQIKIFYEGIYTNDDEDDEREGQEIMSHSLVSKKDYQEYYEDTKYEPCKCDVQGCLSCFLEYYPHTPEIKNGVITSYGSLWLQDEESFNAETLKAETIHEKGDYRIIAEEDYDVSTGGVFQEREDFDDLMELSDTHGMFTLMLQKKVMGGWETIDSVSGVVPHYGDMEDVVLKELNIPDGVNFDAESFNAESGNLVDVNYDAKIRLKNPKDAQYITPSIEEGMAFEKGEGILSSNTNFREVVSGNLVNYHAKIRLFNRSDAQYITPSIEEGMAFEKGEGVLSSNTKITKMNAESRFDKLSNEIADEYEEKGMSPEKAQEVGDATAAKIGRAKYGKTGMRKMQRKGMKADMVGSPSPTFNEDITGQDGPSADPTNQTFEAMRTLAPNADDVRRARRDLKNSGYGDVIYDRYMVYRDGSSNKFYYTAVTEKDGKYYPMGAYGRIGYLSKLFNIYGKTENPRASLSTMDAAYRQCSGKEKAKVKKGYVDYTLQMAESFGSETLAEIEGPTAEATTGGLHAPSSFAMTWEDGTGQSSASIPPNEIAWAENVKAGEGKIFGIGIGTLALGALGIFGVKKLMDKKADTASVDDTKKAEKGCGCSKTVAKSETVKKHSEYSADRINPVEVEGQNDIRNAESISLPQPNAGPQTAHRQNNRPSLKLW